MRMTALTALLAISAFACGGGSNGGDDDVPTDGPGGNTDGPSQTDDGPVNPGNSTLGTTCTPDANNPQGSCPTGFECLSLTGATNPWCSKTCTAGAGDTCATDYTGPGKAACILELEGGGQFCSVICQDMTADPPNQLCAAGQCNGLCPGSLACSGDLQVSINDDPPMVLGQVCE